MLNSPNVDMEILMSVFPNELNEVKEDKILSKRLEIEGYVLGLF